MAFNKEKRMEKTRVSIVSFLNSKPFLYGLQNLAIASEIELKLDIPWKVSGSKT
jgi:hypothetical protein